MASIIFQISLSKPRMNSKMIKLAFQIPDHVAIQIFVWHTAAPQICAKHRRRRRRLSSQGKNFADHHNLVSSAQFQALST